MKIYKAKPGDTRRYRELQMMGVIYNSSGGLGSGSNASLREIRALAQTKTAVGQQIKRFLSIGSPKRRT
jgi:hypothetical protein